MAGRARRIWEIGFTPSFPIDRIKVPLSIFKRKGVSKWGEQSESDIRISGSYE